VPEGSGGGDFAFRPLRKPEEFRAAEELQAEALGPGAALAVPAALLRTFQDHGGLVLGGFADIYLAGVVASSLGWDGSLLYQRAHVLAVRPEYQNHRLGARLAAFQRDEVLRLGLAEVRGGIDPLHRPSAALAVRRLGARPSGYQANLFGQLGAEGAGEESDRLELRWTLAAPQVARRLGGELPSAEEDRRRLAASSAVVETEVGEHGLRRPSAVGEPSGPSASLEIPFDVATIRDHEPSTVRRWRHAVRDGFRAAFDLGYEVDDVATVTVEHERRAFYLLRPGAAAPPPPTPATP